MIKLYEKINTELEKRGLSVWNLSKLIIDEFGTDAIEPTTLYRALNGKTSLRESSIFQIAYSLGTTMDELKKGTDKESKYAFFTFNEKAFLRIIDLNLPYLPGKLTIKPGGKTEILQDPIQEGNFQKLIFVLKGTLTCNIITKDGDQERTTKKTIKKDEEFIFSSTSPHFYENNTEKLTCALVIQSPKYI